MKKSILLFIFWAVATFILTCVYLVITINIQNPQSVVVGRILYLCTGVVTLSVMPLIRYNAKIEGMKWLTVVSKVLLIGCSVWTAAGLMMFATLLLV